MNLLLLILYIIFLCFIWGFFILAKIHAYKFKSFSYYLGNVTNFVFFTLIILTILGFIIIFSMDLGVKTTLVETNTNTPVRY